MQIVQTNILFLPTAGLIVIIPSSLRLLLCSGLNTSLLQVWTALVRDNPSCAFPPFPAVHIVSRKFSPSLHQKAKAASTCSPPLQPIFLALPTPNREQSLFPSSLQQPCTYLHLCYSISSYPCPYSEQPQFFQPSHTGYVFEFSHHYSLDCFQLDHIPLEVWCPSLDTALQLRPSSTEELLCLPYYVQHCHCTSYFTLQEHGKIIHYQGESRLPLCQKWLFPYRKPKEDHTSCIGTKL